MNKLILVLSFLICSVSNAGIAKLSWTHGYKATDGSTITITGFKIYTQINNGPVSLYLTLSGPAPWPWKSVAGMYYYAKTLDNPLWVPGANVCFRMSALAGDLESDLTGPACKVFPMTPDMPNIIDIVFP